MPSLSVTIDSRSWLPWTSQKVQVEDKLCFEVRRPWSLRWGPLTLKSTTGDTVFTLQKERAFVPEYHLLPTEEHPITIRKVSLGYWTCQDNKHTYEVHRYGSIKCILACEGRQLAIMSLSANLPFVDEGKTYLRVHDPEHLNLSIAVALLVDGFGLNLNPVLLNNNKATSVQTV